MGAGGFGHVARLAWVIVNFDHKRIGGEAGAFVEGHRSGVIKMAGVHPEAVDRFFPSFGDCDVHE